MAEVRWTIAAADDLRDIEEYIARDAPLRAVHFVDRLVESTDRLALFPLSGRVVPEFARESLREVVFRTYRIVYLVEADSVIILRVVSAARDIVALAKGESWATD